MYVPDVVPMDDRTEMVENTSFGHEKGIGDRVAVLIVDMTREFVEDTAPHSYPETGVPAAESIARLMGVANERDIPGFYSISLKGDHPAESGRWGATEQTEEMNQLSDILEPSEKDVVFKKYKPSVFFGTQLESMLNYFGVDTVIVTGMTTSGCVRASAVDAFSLNYNVIVPQECVADRSQISHEITLFDLDMKYADVMQLNEIIRILRGNEKG